MVLDDIYNIILKDRNLILSEWLESKSLVPILEHIKMDRDEYKEKIASRILEYFLGIVNNENKVGDCPVMRQLVETFLDSGLCSEDVFLNCSILKNVIVESLFENGIDKVKIREVTTILDKNLYMVLGVYTRQRVAQEKKYSFHTKLIEEHVALSITDTKGVITYVTDAFCTLTGYDSIELLGKTHKIIRHPEMSDNFFRAMWEILNKKHTWKGKIKNSKKDGGEFIAKTEIIPFKDEFGEVLEYVAIRHDITDKELSNMDPLTGLYNRRYYLSSIAECLEKTDAVSLMVIDIDHFKNINDSYGHNFGDFVLKKFAKILTRKLRTNDICIRWGGEEFVVLLPNTHIEKATEIAERIREGIDAYIIVDEKSDKSVDVKCSIGVTQYKNKENPNEFFDRADSNLYSAKNSGRNKVVSG